MIKKILSTSDDLERDLQQFDKCQACVEYIKHFRKEPPSYLHFKMIDTKKVEYKETPAMYWVMITKTDVPEWMRHGPNIRTLYGNTLAMLWIEHVATDPPRWMHHSSLLKNNLGKTCFLLWCYYSHKLAPRWMVYIPRKIKREDCNDDDDIQKMLQRTIVEYSVLKYSSDPIVQFLIVNRHYLVNGLKAKFIYKIFKNLCLEQGYQLSPEETFHVQLRQRIFLKFDQFGNLVYHTRG
jgi:hypothetical protein